MTPACTADEAASTARALASGSGAGDAFDPTVIVGASQPLRAAVATARVAAAAGREAVLLSGAAGTGKALFARAIHYAGCTATEPLLVLCCGGMPQPLLERELFGSGGRDGADGGAPGLAGLAACGTLLITEINEMPPAVQQRLLRAITDGFVTAADGREQGPLRCRIVATSKANLDIAAARGGFDETLLRRLACHRIDLPPLRDRDGDTARLARHFLAQAGPTPDGRQRTLSGEAERVLARHSWPGNVRELKLVIDRVASITDDASVLPAHLTLQHRSARSGASGGIHTSAEICIPAAGKTLQQIEQEAVSLTLQMTRGNRSAAARRLGISRPTLLRKIAALGLR